MSETDTDRLPFLKSMLLCKCPRCTKGDMFKSKATNLKRFNELKPACEVCGYNFQPEPGFYQLSMYFNYATGIAFLLVFGFAAYYLFDDPPLWLYYVIVLTPLVLITPWNLRYSKVIMLYTFGGVKRFWEKE